MISGWGSVALSKHESRALKLADLAQGVMFCVSEINLGNSNMRQVMDRYISYADDMILTVTEKELFNGIKGLLNECK